MDYLCPICGAYVGKILRSIAYDTSLGYRDVCDFECQNGHEIRAEFTWVVSAIRLTPVAADAEQQRAMGDDEPRAAEHDG
jgi:hypothetical protein